MPKVLFRPILARSKRSDFDLIIRHVERALDDTVKPEVVAAHEEEVKDWDHKVQFGSMKRVNDKGISIFVYPKGDNKDIYFWVSAGTPAHDITPKNAPFLEFKWGGPGSHKPKTFPYGKPLRLGGGQSPHHVKMLKVRHPGIEPRHFEKQIADEYYPRFRSVVEAAFKRGIRAAKKVSA